MSMRDLINGEAELDDEEIDESFDEETGEPLRRRGAENGHVDDSSEEEDDDDDEEAARAVGSSPPSPSAYANYVRGPRRIHYR
jgi:transcription elongation factor SPT6